MVREAAAAIARAVATLQAGADTVLLVHRGDDELWRRTAEVLRRQGRSLTEVALDERDARWCLPAAAGVPVLIYHDPFLATENGDELDILRRLVGGGTAVVFVSFPHGLRPPLRDRVRQVYLRALAADERDLRARAAHLRAGIAGMAGLTVAGAAGTLLQVDPPLQVRCDWTSAERDVPILQLPYGEVWIACEPAQVNGTVAVALGPHRTELADVDGGWLRWRWGGAGPAPGEPLVEVGLGTNRHAPWLPQVMLYEKARGAVHVGFGDSALIGGRRIAPVHFDLPLHPDSRIVGLDPALDPRVEEGCDAVTPDADGR